MSLDAIKEFMCACWWQLNTEEELDGATEKPQVRQAIKILKRQLVVFSLESIPFFLHDDQYVISTADSITN